MGVKIFHRRVSLLRHWGKRSSIFCNKWVWEFFTEGFPYLGTGEKGSSIFRNEWMWEFFTEGFPYLVNFKKE